MYKRLSEIIEYLVDNRGKNPPYYTEDGIPVIDTYLIGDTIYPNINSVQRYIDDNLYDKFIRCKTSKNDLLVTLVGNGYGNSCLCNDKQIIIQNAVGLRFKDSVNSIYAYYYFKQKEVKYWIQNLDRGSAQPNVKVSDLLRMKLSLPDYNNQVKISQLLNNYDSLIENNNHRIKLLETMAEELYKEWFVRFRFPNSKKETKHRIIPKGWVYGNNINGLSAPKSWDYKKLNYLGEFTRGKNITSEEMKDGNIEVISAGLEPSGFHNEYNVEGYSLTISASGANAGYLSYHLDNIWAADCSYYNGDNIWFIYHSLNFIKSVIENLQVGSAQPHVYAKNVNKLSIIAPDINIVKEFENKVEYIYSEIKILKDKNKLLTQQRDYLLPRLMSGKLSIENKNII